MSGIDEDIQQWLRLAQSDMTSAEILQQGGQDLNCLFFLQQAIEKTLKALITKQTISTPPRVHNLVKLTELSRLALNKEQSALLDTVNGFYIESRYPEAWTMGPPQVLSQKTGELLNSTKEFLAWLRQRL